MKTRGWGNFRINFRTLLIAVFCIQIGNSFAVANSYYPTQNIPNNVSYTTNTELLKLNQEANLNRVYNFVENDNALLEQNLGITGVGEFIVNGSTSRNIINLNNNSGFTITDDNVNLTVSNVIVTSANSTAGSVLNNQANSSILITNSILENNSTNSQTTNSQGGAIYTKGDVVLKNTSFIGNSATSSGSYLAQGGAISSEGSIELLADSENVVIVDNFTQVEGGEKESNAIYVNGGSGETKTLKLSATNKGSLDLYDKVNGSNYDVVVKGDGTGKVGMYNSLEGANSVNMSDTTVSFCDGEVIEYSFDNLNIGENVDFILDADLVNSKTDTINTTNSSGTVNVSQLNFVSEATDYSSKLQVIKNSDVSLKIDKLTSKLVTSLQPTMYNDNILADSISLGETSFENDSIVINGWKDILYEMVEDKDYTHMLKNFIFRTDAEYTLTKDLGTLGQETILAISNESDAKYGVLNAKGHSMFKLNKPVSKVSLDNILVKNASTSENGSVANLDNNTALFSASNSIIADNKSEGNGGAVYVKNGTATITNSLVTNNTADGKGGAIYTEANVQIVADNGVTTFENNTANGENNAIYVGSKDGIVNLTAKNNGVIYMNDKIDGVDRYLINVNGDETGDVRINNNIKNATLQLNSGVLSPSQEIYLNGNNFVGNGGLLNLINNSTSVIAFNEVSIKNNTYIGIDADLKNSIVDRITSSRMFSSTGKLTIKNINIMSDSDPKKVTVAFAGAGIKDYIVNSVGTAYSKIYKYKVSYDKSTGKLTFNRGSGSSKPNPNPNPKPKPKPSASIYNPNVLIAGITQQIAYTNQLRNYESAFYHSNSYMMLPKIERHYQNKYGAGDVDYVYNKPIQDEVSGVWVKPYSDFESIPLKRGPSVSNIAYGTIFGGDSDLIELKNGFSYVYGGYIGYNGNSTSFEHIHSTQQGAVAGLTAHLYKGNFFNSITANCGWMINESYTWYGTDTMNIIMSGVADRIGYNFELASGKFIIQPSIFFGYTYVYSSDYVSSGDVDINTDALNVIHFAPSIKFIGNLSEGWQPYILVSVMTNFMDKTNFTANTIKLPQMSIDPYVEYGLGLQRRWNENCQAFGQATVRNGGRRGIALLFGLKYMVGKLTGNYTPVPKDKVTDKKVKFKEKKAPEIEIVDWKTAKSKKKPVETQDKPFVAKSTLSDKWRAIKKFLTLKYNTDVSAKVVSDVYADGVIITTLKGQDKSGEYSNFVDVDRQTQDDYDEYRNVKNLEPEGIIIIEEKTNTVQAVKPVSRVETKQQQVKSNRKSDLIRRISKPYAHLFKINQNNYYTQEKTYNFEDYQVEIIKF